MGWPVIGAAVLATVAAACDSRPPVSPDGASGDGRARDLAAGAERRDGVGQPPDRPRAAEQVPGCKQPTTIADCMLPPNAASKDKTYCSGCTCNGPTPAAACNGSNGDCRYFVDGCFPKSYTRCDQNAPNYILGLCGYCFFNDAGPAKLCDKVKDAAP